MPAVQDEKKSLGAYYTPQRVADFLTRWAIRTPSDSVMDPSAGEGVFLRAAHRLLADGNPLDAPRIVGVELSPLTHGETSRVLDADGACVRLLCRDFFDCLPSEIGLFDAVVGNPPFIRFHRFAGAARERALDRARKAGVEMSALTSSWAPFLVHAVSFVAPAGRMAVVAPGELAHAAYAQPVVQYLCDSFRSVRLLVFGKRLFQEISEDTVLVLAEGKGEPFEGLSLHTFDDVEGLKNKLGRGVTVERPSLNGVTRLTEYLLPPQTRALYRELCGHPAVVRLDALADVGIGYVTGGNDYFHLSADEVRKYTIPQLFLARAIRRISDAPGLRFTRADWRGLHETGSRNLLLRVNPSHEDLPDGLRRYIRSGSAQGVSRGYKCRNRTPWYAVPHVHRGDAFLSYMSGHQSRLVLNGAGAFAPNTLHVVRLRQRNPDAPSQLALSWTSSLVALSCEIEGHSMGGGMLKLEPTEAGRVLVPLLQADHQLIAELDSSTRNGRAASVVEYVDAKLRDVLGLSQTDVNRLKAGADLLRNRRNHR